MTEPAIFDDVRRALVFALNADEVRMPAPSMTVAMAQGLKQRKAKAKRSKSKKNILLLDEALSEEEALMAERRSLVRAAFRRPSTPFRGLDKSAQAGFILAELSKLDRDHQVVLTGLLTRSHRPCDCRRPCCSGWAQNLRWTNAVSEMCVILRELAASVAIDGKRGLSTQPTLRKAIVEQYFTKREIRLVDLATLAECSQVTAAKHRAWIVEFLDQKETEAWPQISELLDQAGIVGAFLD